MISREKDGTDSIEKRSDVIEEMNQEELLALQARIVNRLRDDGYFRKER